MAVGDAFGQACRCRACRASNVAPKTPMVLPTSEAEADAEHDLVGAMPSRASLVSRTPALEKANSGTMMNATQPCELVLESLERRLRLGDQRLEVLESRLVQLVLGFGQHAVVA